MTEDLQNENQNLENTLSVQKKRKKATAVRSGNRKVDKVKRIGNIVERVRLRAPWKKWVENTSFHLSINDGAELGAKIIYKRRLRNNFDKLLAQSKKVKRGANIE